MGKPMGHGAMAPWTAEFYEKHPYELICRIDCIDSLKIQVGTGQL